MNRIAINTNALKAFSLNEALRIIKKDIGCRYVELTTDGKAHGYPCIFDNEINLFPEDIRYICLSGGWVDLARGNTELINQQVALMERMYINKIRLFISNPHDESWNFNLAVETLQKLSIEYPTIYFLIENHGGLTSSIFDTANLLKSVGMVNVATVFDPANYTKTKEDNIYILGRIFPHIKHVHVKDIDKNGNFCCVGNGIIDWKRILQDLKGRGYRGDFSVEYEGNENKIQSLKKSYKIFVNIYKEVWQ